MNFAFDERIDRYLDTVQTYDEGLADVMREHMTTPFVATELSYGSGIPDPAHIQKHLQGIDIEVLGYASLVDGLEAEAGRCRGHVSVFGVDLFGKPFKMFGRDWLYPCWHGRT